MWWYGRGNSGGSWMPEEKKAGPEGEIVVAHGRLPSPARTAFNCKIIVSLENSSTVPLTPPPLLCLRSIVYIYNPGISMVAQ